MDYLQSILTLICASLLLGFVMAAPVGPVAILCIRRTLKRGFGSGFTTGLGVAAVDSIYGWIACLGSNNVTEILGEYKFWIRLIGGIVLVLVGISISRANPKVVESDREESPRYLHNFTSAILLTLTNPLSIFSFAAIYLGLNLSRLVGSDPLRIAIFVVSIFTGAALWWAFLSRLTLHWKTTVTAARMRVINQICGGLVVAFGLASLIF